MASNKKNLLKTRFTANAGCRCGRPKLSDVYEPKPKPKTSAPKNPRLCSSSRSCDINNALSATENDDLTSISFSFNNIDNISHITDLNSESEFDLSRPSKVLLSTCLKTIVSIIAEKDSNDLYQDFQHFMHQMIMEKQIYSKNDLQKLLQCFLKLNSPCYCNVIVKVFMETWNHFTSKEIVIVKDQHPCLFNGE
ncbi:transcription repressor OFP7-like [Durio zibethinus]|uniref:Transcription repressor n=1 Tax=Durio zibethinus TaxID=66656 RepID=A0A6P5XPL8_DURZI|nr:transcription repressor OFP7-like [Durio zibethinus]